MNHVAPRSKRNKPNKQKAARVARGERQALESLAEKRRPFEPLLREIVAAVLHAASHPPDGNSAPGHRQGAGGVSLPAESHGETWVEVGCGLGQLRSLLPQAVLPKMTHTDLSEFLVRGLLQKYPKARAEPASVNRLPFETGSVGAVLGLCAFDSFPDHARAAREIGRVLRDGGRFVHFLDAATNIEPVLTGLVSAGRLPLPNFFADIALRRPDLVDAAHAGKLVEPYFDVLSVPLAQFGAVTEMLQRAGHLMAPMLQRYLAAFTRQPFEVLPAARAFVELTSDPNVGRPMNQALMSLFTTLRQPPYSEQVPFDVQSHSTLVHFKATLDHYFGPAFGFDVRISTIVYARAYEADDQTPLRARVRRVGIGQNSVHWPERRGMHTSRFDPRIPGLDESNVSPETHVLREAAVYCLVADKQPTAPSVSS